MTEAERLQILAGYEPPTYPWTPPRTPESVPDTLDPSPKCLLCGAPDARACDRWDCRL